MDPSITSLMRQNESPKWRRIPPKDKNLQLFGLALKSDPWLSCWHKVVKALSLKSTSFSQLGAQGLFYFTGDYMPKAQSLAWAHKDCLKWMKLWKEFSVFCLFPPKLLSPPHTPVWIVPTRFPQTVLAKVTERPQAWIWFGGNLTYSIGHRYSAGINHGDVYNRKNIGKDVYFLFDTSKWFSPMCHFISGNAPARLPFLEIIKYTLKPPYLPRYRC